MGLLAKHLPATPYLCHPPVGALHDVGHDWRLILVDGCPRCFTGGSCGESQRSRAHGRRLSQATMADPDAPAA